MFRYMSMAEYTATSGTITPEGVVTLRGGREGDVFMTPDVYLSAHNAQDRLSLPNTPEVGVAYFLLTVPVIYFGPAAQKENAVAPGLPSFDTQGGGIEILVKGPNVLAIPIHSWTLTE